MMKSRIARINMLRDISLGWKFSLLVGGGVLLMGVLTIYFIESVVSTSLYAEHRERGNTLTRIIEADAVDLLLTANRIKLHQLLV